MAILIIAAIIKQVTTAPYFIFAFVGILSTVLPFINWDYWWIRGFDFPRLQIATCLVVIFLMPFGLSIPLSYEFYAIEFLLAACLIYQLSKIFKYTFLAKAEVRRSGGGSIDNDISVLISNVLTTNERSDLLISLVKKHQPDLLLTLETNMRWQSELEPIKTELPHTVAVPLENFYGMHLFSRFELIEPQIKYLVSRETPSIHSRLKLKSGREISIFCLHPKPPAPSESHTSTNRDAELLMVGREIENSDKTALVFGDMNDVAWSRTTRIFKKISGLLDPRVGRGLYNTFNAKNLLMRWPLDHIFHTSDFELNRIERLSKIGSDHYPIMVSLKYSKASQSTQEPEPADAETDRIAEEKIEKAASTE